MTTPIDPLVAQMVEQLDLDLREAFEERAAIVEFEAGVQRAHAEALALLRPRPPPGRALGRHRAVRRGG